VGDLDSSADDGPVLLADGVVFTLLALSDPLAVEAGASADTVKRAAQREVLAEGRLTARYGR
jgi:hypothetical protein